MTKTVYNNSVVYNGGPELAAINQRTSDKIQTVKLKRNEDMAAISGGTTAKLQGDQLQVFAPTVRPAQGTEKPKKVKEKIESAQVDRGWNVSDAATTEKIKAKYRKDAKGTGASATTTGRTGKVKTEGSTGANEASTPPSSEEKKAAKKARKNTGNAEAAPPQPPPPPAPTPTTTESAPQERKAEKKTGGKNKEQKESKTSAEPAPPSQRRSYGMGSDIGANKSDASREKKHQR